jgi:Holliday junction resolvase RusA-like endonuclease
MLVDVDGRPAPKGSRVFGRTKNGNPYTRPASRYEKPWVEAVKAATQLAARHHDPLDAPYSVELEFRLRVPRRNRPEMPWWPTAHDIDKLTRATIDGLVQGGALSDDRHVTVLTARKRYVTPGESEGVSAQIQSVPARAMV